MTSQTIDAPAPARATPARPDPGLWRRTVLWSVVVPLAVLAPLGAVPLTVAAVLFAESVVCRGHLFRQPPSRLSAVLPFVLGAGFLVAGPSGGPDLLRVALVLAVAAAVCRIDRELARLGRRRAVLLVAGGAAVGACGGIVWLAVPFAAAALVARGMVVLIGRRRSVATGAPARALGLLALGLAPTYAWLGGAAWSPLPAWSAGGVSGRLVVPAVAVVALLAWQAARDVTLLARLDRLQLAGVAAAAGALAVLGAGPVPAVAVTAGALLTAVLALVVTAGRRDRAVPRQRRP